MDFLAEHGLPVEGCGAVGCEEDSAEHVEQCGFASTVGADDADDLAGINLESNPADGTQAAERFRQIRHCQQPGAGVPGWVTGGALAARKAGSEDGALGVKKRSRIVQNRPSGEACMMAMMATP